MAAWFPGTEAGAALTRVLFGETNPTGRLVLSWPRSVGQEPLYYNQLPTGRPIQHADPAHPGYVEMKYVSRYLDELNTPQFPFGYGGSYTSYSYGITTISTQRLSAAALNRVAQAGAAVPPAMTAEAEVTNTGSRAGDEVVQLYIQLQGTRVAQPVRALKGFQTVAIAPGETRKVKFEIAPEALAIWNDRNQFAAETAKVKVWISADSAHGSPAQAEILP